MELDVFAHQRDAHAAVQVLDALEHLPPLGHVGLGRFVQFSSRQTISEKRLFSSITGAW